jgi:hypothetical protein
MSPAFAPSPTKNARRVTGWHFHCRPPQGKTSRAAVSELAPVISIFPALALAAEHHAMSARSPSRPVFP